MPSINMQQCFVRNEQLKHYPKVSINSIPSRYLLMISSTSNIYGKCLFVLIVFITNLVHCRGLLYMSLDSVFSVQLRTFIYFLHGNWIFMVFYLRYNHNLLKQIDEHWNGLQIDFDYETRKYFWTRKAFYRYLTYVLFTLSIIITYGSQFYAWNDKDNSKLSREVFFKQNIIFYFLLMICVPIVYFNYIFQCFIQMDLPILAQTAVQFNLIRLKRLLNEAKKDEKSLNINAIQNIRQKYLLCCGLVDKIDEVMSPCLFLMFTDFVVHASALSHALLYTELNQSTQWAVVMQNSLNLINAWLFTRSTLQIHEKSLESLAIVYKLSMKTNSIHLLNEISLFLNHNEIGFTFGGMFMLTTSSLSTLFSVLITFILALPSFAT
uniref:Gustatory receptor n=1 Tax=Tetranychus urticae TaxID=32264 RepID=T1KJE8_TETUR